MTPPVKLQITGLRKTVRSLERMGTESNDLKTLMTRISAIVITSAQPLTPRGLTGNLAASIRPGKGKTKAVIRSGSHRVPYAGIRHYGYKRKDIQGTHFLTAAIETQTPRILTELDRGIDELIQRTGNK